MSEIRPEQEQPSYLPLEELVLLIEGENGRACQAILASYDEKFSAFPGSSGNHQAWPGGYRDHITEVMNIGRDLYTMLNVRRELPFSQSDVLLIMFLHDLEKPFKYTYDAEGVLVKNPDLLDKNASEEFKRNLMESFGITLNAMQDNALEFVEGIRDDKYRKDRRVMGELAALCHMADVWSARGWYNSPAPEGDQWQGAQRCSPASFAITLATEFPTD